MKLDKQMLADLVDERLDRHTVRAIQSPGYSHLYSERFGLLLGGPIQADPTTLMA